MATYVLVPGAWLGGWCWRRVTPLLRAAGHEVFTPTCTGLGERVHLGGPEVGLETHDRPNSKPGSAGRHQVLNLDLEEELKPK